MGDLMTSAGIDGSRDEGENGVEEENEEKVRLEMCPF